MKTPFSIILILALVSLFMFGCQSPKITTVRESEKYLTATVAPEPTNVIILTQNALKPTQIIISRGETVLFKNTANYPQQVATDSHPSHEKLPDFYSRPLYKDEIFRYTFQQPGTWGFHLENNPSISGKIIVQ